MINHIFGIIDSNGGKICELDISNCDHEYLMLSMFVYSLHSTTIYIQKVINNNKIDFYDYLLQLNQKLQIETIICLP